METHVGVTAEWSGRGVAKTVKGHGRCGLFELSPGGRREAWLKRTGKGGGLGAAKRGTVQLAPWLFELRYSSSLFMLMPDFAETHFTVLQLQATAYSWSTVK